LALGALAGWSIVDALVALVIPSLRSPPPIMPDMVEQPANPKASAITQKLSRRIS
jgi:hypothetical protein